MRWIYLSPHLDDAVLSAGGLIYEQSQAGIPVEIWTFMCGYAPEEAVSPFAQLLHTQWGFSSAEETIRMRREEDKTGCGDGRRERSSTSIFWTVFTGAGQMANGSIRMYLRRPTRRMRPSPLKLRKPSLPRLQPDDVLVCQLSVGSHVDHVLVRQGAELLGRSLRYDIDVPYIFYKPEELSPKSAGMKESVHSITEAGLQFLEGGGLGIQISAPRAGRSVRHPGKSAGIPTFLLGNVPGNSFVAIALVRSLCLLYWTVKP